MEKFLQNGQPHVQSVGDQMPIRQRLERMGLRLISLLPGGMRGCLWLYSILAPVLWLMHQQVGDQLWWLALLSSFTPHFFWPLPFLWPLALSLGRSSDRLLLSAPTFLFLYLYGGLFLPNRLPAHQTEPRPLHLMTFNMWTGTRGTNTARIIIDRGLPDIVALQEVSYGMQSTIEKTIGNYYLYQDFNYSGRGGLAVLSHYPLQRLSSDMLIDLFCSQYRVTVDATHQFRLYNCHPYSTHVTYATGRWRALANEVEESFRLRTRLGERLAKEIQSHGEATIVLGDFNTTDQSDAYHQLTTVLSDAHRTSGWGFGHTFPAGTALFRKPPVLPRLVRIDLILYSPAFVALQSAVGSTYGKSDHLPLRAVLAWRTHP